MIFLQQNTKPPNTPPQKKNPNDSNDDKERDEPSFISFTIHSKAFYNTKMVTYKMKIIPGCVIVRSRDSLSIRCESSDSVISLNLHGLCR